MKVIVVCFCRSGNTELMAEEINKRFNELSDCESELYNALDVNVETLPDYDVIVIGSASSLGTVTSEIKDFFDKTIPLLGKLEGKVGAAFAASPRVGIGADMVIMDIIKFELAHGMIVKGNPKGPYYGPLSIGKPTEECYEECAEFVKKVYELAKKVV